MKLGTLKRSKWLVSLSLEFSVIQQFPLNCDLASKRDKVMTGSFLGLK